jgi:hypothetical protein
MPRDLSIADRCRDAGLTVVEVAGWQTRGASYFNPRGSVNHHTAGSARGTAPSLLGVVHGFRGSAPGPLANVLQSREADGNDKFYIVAAGVANHAGKGGWTGLRGNSSVIGLEIEHTGLSELLPFRKQLAARFHAAMATGRWSAAMVCQHFEWAPGRKPDAATGVSGIDFRRQVQAAMTGPPQNWEDDEMPKGAQMMVWNKAGTGYWIVASDGGVFAYGTAGFFDSMGGKPMNAPIVGIAITPTEQGYSLLGQDGGIFSFGDAQFLGAPTGKVN